MVAIEETILMKRHFKPWLAHIQGHQLRDLISPNEDAKPLCNLVNWD